MFKKAGVIFTRIEPENAVVADLFDERNRTRDAALQRTLDIIRSRSGRNAIMIGTQMPIAAEDGGKVYKADYRSPLYTTDISQILTVKV